jgi:hypothetical protein
MTATSGYYLAMMETFDHASRQAYGGAFLVLAKTDQLALDIALDRVATRGQHKGERQRDGGYYFDIEEKGCTAYLKDLRELSNDTMKQVVHVIPCYGDAEMMPDAFESHPRMVQF